MLTVAALCLVISVHDGDTMRVRCEHHTTPVVIRLAWIDAPELQQPWGKASRHALAALCLRTHAWVQPHNADKYGRTVATVSCRAADASARQVERGMAWVFHKYAPVDTPLAAMQQRAQNQRRGLWRDPAIEPAAWRHSRS